VSIVDTFFAVEEGIFAARVRIGAKASANEANKRSEIGLRRFVGKLPLAIDGRLSIALLPDGQFSLRAAVIGQWLCVLKFHNETYCEYQAHTEYASVRCWTKGAGTIEHVTQVINVFGVPVRVGAED
jgi:hypothetical protein